MVWCLLKFSRALPDAAEYKQNEQ
eukprot:COSAG02_NODE_46959_length_344_cov_36.224490_1_plen_23_part_10